MSTTHTSSCPTAQTQLREYRISWASTTNVTGAPVLLPEYAFYEGHLNCYNRDSWSDNSGSKKWEIKGSASATTADEVSIASSYYESGMSTGYVLKDGMSSETLNGTKPTTALDKYPSVNTDYKYSARAVIDQYDDYDMPIGYFLPNDGYGCGYGQNGYYQTGGVTRTAVAVQSVLQQ